MSLRLREYKAPDFTEKKFVVAPDCSMEKAPEDGIAPFTFHALSIFPEYFKVNGKWLLLEESRMDTVPVYEDGRFLAVEPRRLKKGQLVVVGRTENCEDGIYIHANGFRENKADCETFAFRTGRSRETSFSRDFDEIVELLKYEKQHGNVVWVMGPAFAFDPRARNAFAAIIENGYADAVLAGNALATHDIEGAYLNTALGQDIYTQENVQNGHYNHLDILNRVRFAGSMKNFIEQENLNDGIMAAAIRHNVPVVLGGSIRDDGPMPDLYGNCYEAQDRMREYVSKATTVISMATMLHSIAVGNMTPSFRVLEDGTVRQIYFYVCDVSEFVINKLADRGSLSSKGIVTNVQDFICNIADGLKLEY